MDKTLVTFPPEFSNYDIYNSDCQKIKLKSLFKYKKNIIIFVRHFNWYVCRDFVVALGKLSPQIFESCDSKFFVIGCSPAERILSFSSDTNLDPNILFSDPTLGLFTGLGLIKAKDLSEIAGKEKSKETKTSLVTGLAWSTYKSIKHRPNVNVYQVKISKLCHNWSL